MTRLRLAGVLQAATAHLQRHGMRDAAKDARILLAHAAHIPPDRLTLHLQDDVTAEVDARFSHYISARLRHQPVAQIIGKRLFWGRSFIVTQDTLDPRPETEILIAEALRGPITSVLDMGTGTGCIVLSLLGERPQALGVGSDISKAALAVAAQNAADLGITARFMQSDWFAAIGGQFDLIVSNPPYIAADEMARLSPDVALWEPHLALTPGGDGLDAYRAIAAGARGHLRPQGRLLLEIGPTQGAAVMDMLARAGMVDLRILPDFDGRDRVVCAKSPD